MSPPSSASLTATSWPDQEEIIFTLGQHTVRVSVYIPTTQRKWKWPVPGRRYVLRWNRDGILANCRFQPTRTRSATAASETTTAGPILGVAPTAGPSNAVATTPVGTPPDATPTNAANPAAPSGRSQRRSRQRPLKDHAIGSAVTSASISSQSSQAPANTSRLPQPQAEPNLRRTNTDGHWRGA